MRCHGVAEDVVVVVRCGGIVCVFSVVVIMRLLDVSWEKLDGIGNFPRSHRSQDCN